MQALPEALQKVFKGTSKPGIPFPFLPFLPISSRMSSCWRNSIHCKLASNDRSLAVYCGRSSRKARGWPDPTRSFVSKRSWKSTASYQPFNAKFICVAKICQCYLSDAVLPGHSTQICQWTKFRERAGKRQPCFEASKKIKKNTS